MIHTESSSLGFHASMVINRNMCRKVSLCLQCNLQWNNWAEQIFINNSACIIVVTWNWKVLKASFLENNGTSRDDVDAERLHRGKTEKFDFTSIWWYLYGGTFEVAGVAVGSQIFVRSSFNSCNEMFANFFDIFSYQRTKALICWSSRQSFEDKSFCCLLCCSAIKFNFVKCSQRTKGEEK